MYIVRDGEGEKFLDCLVVWLVSIVLLCILAGGFPGGMPGNFPGGMPGMGAGMPGMAGMPGLNEILSDPEVLAAMQVRLRTPVVIEEFLIILCSDKGHSVIFLIFYLLYTSFANGTFVK
jgi:hypothetical protein